MGISVDLLGQIYVVGGYDGVSGILGYINTLEKYDPTTDTWYVKSPSPVYRNAPGFTFSPTTGKFYLAGGYYEDVFKDVYEYDPIKDLWTPKTSMQIPRFCGKLAAANGKIYSIGGFTTDGTAVSAIEEYDPLANTWILKSTLPTPRGCEDVVTAPNGKIYVIGGHLDYTGGNAEVSVVEIYDPSSNTWDVGFSMPTPKSIFSLSLNSQGNIYAIGGLLGGSPLNTVEEYNINNNIWTAKTSLPVALMHAGAALGSDGKVYVIGGQTSSSQAVNTNYAGFAPDVSSINLSVPLFKQTDPLWGGYEYDSANKWSQNPTISAWGCALTSAAMVFKYHGYHKLPDGTNLDPGTLNSWLKTQKDGYVRNGLVNWLALSRLSKLAKEENGLGFNALEYHRVNGYNSEKLTDDINNGNPGILGVPGHFVVAKGVEGDTFNINDPFYDRTTLESYDNTFNSLGTYVPSSTDLSYIMLVVDDDIDISLTDSNNVATGSASVQEPLDNDSGDGTSGEPLNIFYLPKPTSGEYSLNLSSNSDQNYQLDVYFYDEEGNVKILNLSGFVSDFNDDNFEINFDKDDLSNSLLHSDIYNLRFDLGVLLNSGDIKNRGIYQSFISKLNSYEKAKDTKTKLNILNAMTNETNAQRGKGLTELAHQIILDNINSIIDLL